MSRCSVAEDVIRSYLKSEAFGNPFVYFNNMSGEYARQSHGPFLRTEIRESDFELISRQKLEEDVRAIRHLDEIGGPVSDEKWESLEKLLERICSRNRWLFSLRLTEKDKSRFHDAGFVLVLFREFIFANPDSEFIERLVFGCD